MINFWGEILQDVGHPINNQSVPNEAGLTLRSRSNVGVFWSKWPVCQGRSTPYYWGFWNPEIMGIFSPYGIGLMSLSLSIWKWWKWWKWWKFLVRFLTTKVPLCFLSHLSRSPNSHTAAFQKGGIFDLWKRRVWNVNFVTKTVKHPKKNRAAQLTYKSGS